MFRKAKRPAAKRKYAPRPPRGKYVPSGSGRRPAYRIGRYAGNYRKGPKPRVGRTAERHIDTSYTIDQPMVNYTGFQTYGSIGDILLTYCYALCRQIAAKSGCHLTSFQQRMQDQDPTENTGQTGVDITNRSRLGYITFRFSKADMHGNKIYSVDEYNVINENYSQTWSDFAAWIRDRMMVTCGNDGYSPESYSLSTVMNYTAYENADPSTTTRNGVPIPFFTNERWGDDIVQFSCKSITKVNNVTPAGTDRHDINDVNANPLQGKLYDFKNASPIFSDQWLKTTDTNSTWADIEKLQSIHLRQDMLQTQRLRMRVPVTGTADYTYTALHPDFKQPPRGSTVWKNVAGVRDVRMEPGGFKTIVRSGTVVASTRRFIGACFRSHVDVNNISLSGKTQTQGTNLGNDFDKRIKTLPVLTPSFILALEPTVRTSTNEEVKLVVNRDVHQTCNIKRAPSRGTAKQITVRSTSEWPIDYEDNNQVYVDAT